MIYKLKTLIKTALLGLLLISSSSFAQTGFILQPSALFFGTCKISSTNINFGTIVPNATGEKTTTGTISSLCSFLTFYSIQINKGNGTFANRQMAGTSTNTDKLSYQIYKNSNYTEVLGDGTGSTEIYSGLGLGLVNTNTVYAKLPLNQYIKPDNYSDTLIVSITY